MENITNLSIDELWTAACSGDLQTLQNYYNAGGEPNRRYERFGKEHSLIAGACRNEYMTVVDYLYSCGEKPLPYEEEEILTSRQAMFVIQRSKVVDGSLIVSCKKLKLKFYPNENELADMMKCVTETLADVQGYKAVFVIE